MYIFIIKPKPENVFRSFLILCCYKVYVPHFSLIAVSNNNTNSPGKIGSNLKKKRYFNFINFVVLESLIISTNGGYLA